jgi:glutamate---cysteine ligase / carboxylate-amine ligase
LGYRNAANDALPRTGFPENFRNLDEYQTYVDTLVEAGIVPGATYVWWALRPSLQYPTLGLRLTDCCTALADSVAIAALFRALVRHTINHPQRHNELSAVQRALVEENRWRAQRYGTDSSYIDTESLEPVSFRTWLEGVLSMLADDIDALQIESDIPKLRGSRNAVPGPICSLNIIERLRNSAAHPEKRFQTSQNGCASAPSSATSLTRSGANEVVPGSMFRSSLPD